MITARYGIPKVEVPSFKSQALRDSARGAPCMFGFDGCDEDVSTVWVHSDRLKHGNGWGTKGHDFHGAYGCTPCHSFYASKSLPDDEREAAFQKAHEASWRWLLETGRVRITKR